MLLVHLFMTKNPVAVADGAPGCWHAGISDYGRCTAPVPLPEAPHEVQSSAQARAIKRHGLNGTSNLDFRQSQLNHRTSHVLLYLTSVGNLKTNVFWELCFAIAYLRVNDVELEMR